MYSIGICYIDVRRFVRCIKFAAICHDGELRLVGSFILEGRLEICFKEEWGTICDDRWDDVDATVACRELGFSDTG